MLLQDEYYIMWWFLCRHCGGNMVSKGTNYNPDERKKKTTKEKKHIDNV